MVCHGLQRGTSYIGYKSINTIKLTSKAIAFYDYLIPSPLVAVPIHNAGLASRAWIKIHPPHCRTVELPYCPLVIGNGGGPAGRGSGPSPGLGRGPGRR